MARRGEEDGRQMEEDKEDKEVDGGGRSSKEEPEQGEGQEGGGWSREEKSSRASKEVLLEEVGLALR